MIVPRWLDTKTQPVALKDVITALADVGERDEAPDEVQLGGAEVLTYREMMRRAAPLMGRRPPLVVRVPVLTPRLSSYWVALVTPVSYGLIKPLVDGLGAEMLVDDSRPRPGSTTTRSASRTPSAKRSHEAAQPPRRAADRQRGDRRSGAAHGDGRGRLGPLDPGRERRHAGRRARGTLEAGQPRAARADLLEVPQPRHARDHPRHLHRGGARRRRDRPAARAAALPRPRIRLHGRPRDRAVADPGRPARLAAQRGLPRDRRQADASPTARTTDASMSRSRSRTSTRRSRHGSRAGSTRTRSRASTCWSRTASCARWPGSNSRSPRSAASPRAASARARSTSATRPGRASPRSR